MIGRLFAPERDSRLTSFALLVLRLWLGLAMLINHGMPKITKFGNSKESFPDPLGIGSPASLALAIFAEAVCSLLLISGLLTRFAALTLAVLTGVAFGVVHGFSLSGESSGELAFIYMAGYVVLLIAGPGWYSPDQRLFGPRGPAA